MSPQQKKSERRRTKRIRRRAAARATTKQGSFDGFIVNFSEVGLLLQLPKQLKPGNVVTLEAGAKQKISLHGKVIWSQLNLGDESWNSGVAILSPPAEWLALVKKAKSDDIRYGRGIDERFEVEHNVQLGEGTTPSGQTGNLSLGGMYLNTPMQLETGTELRSQIELPGIPKPLQVKGRVMYRLDPNQAATKGRKPGVGVQFMQMEPESKSVLRHYLRRLTIHRQRPERRTVESLAMYGSLSDYLVPEILWFLYEREVSGCLHLEHGERVKTIYMTRGNPVYIESTERTEALGHFLLRKDRLDTEGLAKALAEAKENDLRLGEVLLKNGLLESSELTNYLIEHQEEKLTNTFSWFDGTYVFAERMEWPEGICLFPLRTPRILINGITRWYKPEMVASWMGLTGGTIVGRSDRPVSSPDLPSAALQTLERAASPQLIDDLARKSRTTVSDQLPLVFALVVVGSLKILPSAQRSAVAAPKTSDPKPTPKPTKAPPTAPKENSALAEKIRQEYPRLQIMNFYELLRVRADTTDADLTKNFESSSRPFAPENLESLEDQELRTKGLQIVSWLRLAHDVLRDPHLRHLYARHGARTAKNKDDRLRRIEAERHLLRGLREIEKKEFSEAAHTLELASKLFPDEASAQGYLAWALFNVDQKANLKQACDMLDRVIAKERGDAQIWYYRGEIYVHLRNWTEALDCFDHAIRLNPRFAEAIEASGKARRHKKKDEDLIEESESS